MNIKKTIDRVPGGMMLIPMFFSATVNTFWPEVWKMGGFVTQIVSNHNAFIGGFLLCMGAGMSYHTAPKALKIGLVTTLSKYAFSVALGLSVAYLWGADGIWGLSTLAIISAVSNTNGGLYSALTAEFGSQEEIGAISVLSVNDGPFLTMIAMGTAGLANIPFWDLVGVILPIVVGMVLGNLDKEMKNFLSRGGDIMVPLMAIALGTRLNYYDVVRVGVAGVVLGLITVVVGGTINVLFDRATGGTGVAGMACSSTAGNAVGTPAALALVDPALAPLAPIATPLVAASTITTALLVPIFTAIIYKKNVKRNPSMISYKYREQGGQEAQAAEKGKEATA